MITSTLLDIQHVSSDNRPSLTLTHQFFDLQLFYKVFILIKAVNTLISLMSSVTRDIYSLVSVLGDGSSHVSLRFLPSSPVKGFSSLTLVEGSGQRTSHLVKDSEFVLKHVKQFVSDHQVKSKMEMPGIEPGTSYMRSTRSTTELHPHRVQRELGGDQLYVLLGQWDGACVSSLLRPVLFV